MRAEKGYGGLDYFRMAAAFLVVAIHTSPLTSFSEEADFILTRVIARTAVPFFFMVTGYFLLPRYLFRRSMDRQPLAHLLYKHLILYITAVFLYLPVNLYAGQLENVSAGEVIRRILADGTFYHLWYLPAAILGIVLVWFWGRRLPFPLLLGISLILYLAGLFGDSYYGLAERIPAVKKMYDVLFSVFSYTRNGIFYAPIFLVMGAEASRERQSEKRRQGLSVYAAGFSLSLALMIGEGQILRKLHLQRHDSMYFMLLPVMFFLFRTLLLFDLAPVKKFRTVSAGIYLLHPLCIILVRGAGRAVHLEGLFVENSLGHYAAVCAVSWAAARGIAAVVCRRKAGGFLSAGSRGSGMGRTGKKRGQCGEESRAWIELSRENLQGNVRVLKGMLAPGQKLMPVLKADAYGHGAVLIAGQLQEMGIDFYCVACAAEGCELRKNGITGDILILGYTHPDDFFLLRKYRLIQTVVDYDYAKLLESCGKKIRVHVKVDTGMHRLGERAEKCAQIGRIFRLKNLQVEGLYTHLCADETRDREDLLFTRAQEEGFYSVVRELERQGYTGFKTHLLASYGLLNYPELGGDYVRAGIALYGLLSEEREPAGSAAGLQPVLSLKTRIAAVKDVYPGETVGYGQAYRAENAKRIAVLAIGYGDGLPRGLSCGMGRVLIHGQSAPVVGRICMDQTIVDVSGISDVRAGEIATVIGKSGEEEITAYELAGKTGTITNEILSRLGNRLVRVLR